MQRDGSRSARSSGRSIVGWRRSAQLILTAVLLLLPQMLFAQSPWERAANNLDAMLADARPGIQNFSKNTLPEANRMVRDLRELSESMRALTERVEQGGIGSALGPEKLPDYKPRDGR